MKSKKRNIIAIFLGVLFFVGSLIFLETNHPTNLYVRNIVCFCFVIGFCVFAMGTFNLFIMKYYKNNPQKLKQNEIDYEDERNTLIRYKSKAKSGDIISWFIIGIAYVTIIVNAPIWVSFVIICVFLLKFILEIYFMNKYQNEM